MQGACVPFVAIPRYTSFVGDQGEDGFTTVPMDLSAYDRGFLTVWRGPIVADAAGATVLFYLEDSEDAQHWGLMLSQGPDGLDPGEDQTVRIAIGVLKKWFRVRTDLSGDDPAMTCWAVGELVTRVG